MMDPSKVLFLVVVFLSENGRQVEPLNLSSSGMKTEHEVSSSSSKWVQQTRVIEKITAFSESVANTRHAESKQATAIKLSNSPSQGSTSRTLPTSRTIAIVRQLSVATSTRTEQVYSPHNDVAPASSAQSGYKQQSSSLPSVIPSPSVNYRKSSSIGFVTAASGKSTLSLFSDHRRSLLETSAETTTTRSLVQEPHTQRTTTKHLSTTTIRTTPLSSSLSSRTLPSPGFEISASASRSSASMRMESVAVKEKVLSRSTAVSQTSLSELQSTTAQFIQASVQISPGLSSSQTLIDLASVYSANLTLGAKVFVTSVHGPSDTSTLPAHTWYTAILPGEMTAATPVSSTISFSQGIKVSVTAAGNISESTVAAIPTVTASSGPPSSSSSVDGSTDEDPTGSPAPSHLSTLKNLYIMVIVAVGLVILILIVVCGVFVRLHRSRYTSKPEFRYSVKWEFIEEGQMRCINSRLDLSIKGLYCDLEVPMEPTKDPLFQEKVTTPEEKEEIEYLSKLCEEDYQWLNDVIKKDLGSSASLGGVSDVTNRMSSYSDNGSVVEKENIEPSEKGSLSYDLKSIGCTEPGESEPEDDSRSCTSDEDDVSVWDEAEENNAKRYDIAEVQVIGKEEIDSAVLKRYIELSDKDKYSLKKEKKVSKFNWSEKKPELKDKKPDVQRNEPVKDSVEIQTQ